MTFSQLKNSLRQDLFPAGEAPELVAPHNKSIVSALIDLQSKVECLQRNNTQVVKFCNTMFQCGMTVIPAPRGRLLRLSTFVRTDEDCEEDADSDVNYCSEVVYSRVSYDSLTRLLDKRLACQCDSTLESLVNLTSDLCRKTIGDAYPAPDDADYEGFPELPFGFHYPQASTDSTKSRAVIGVYAVHHGRIYIAPWIQSTEVIVMEWDGLKRDWDDADIVDDDPVLERAVRLYVSKEHARDYEKSSEDYSVYDRDYREAVAELIQNCRDETREMPTTESKARMSGAVLTDEIAPCPTTTTTSTTTGA